MEKLYTIPKKGGGDWQQIPAAHIDNALWGGAFGIQAEARVCYDERALYVYLSAKEKEIRAENTALLDEPCQDSCLEFFFCPVLNDNRYFNMEFNLNRCMFLGMGSSIRDVVRLLPLEDHLFAPQSRRTSEGWEITYSVPHTFVRRFFPAYAPGPGYTMRGNFYKCGDLTVHPHYLAWSPITTETPTFHYPADFGTLVFD